MFFCFMLTFDLYFCVCSFFFNQYIDGLSKMDEYKQKLNVNLHQPLPPPPPEIVNENFYGAILNICLRHNLQQPRYEIQTYSFFTHSIFDCN